MGGGSKEEKGKAGMGPESIAGKYGGNYGIRPKNNNLADFNLAVCSSTRIPNTRTHTCTEILAASQPQSAKLNSPAKFPGYTVG